MADSSDALYAITYASHNDIVGDTATARQQIESILTASRTNNECNGVTGLLMFSPVCFAQILEGGREAVEKTFGKLSRDPRHSDIVVLTRGNVARRAFDDWAMASVEDEADLLGGFFAQHRAGNTAASGSVLDQPLPPYELLLDEVEHLAGTLGRDRAAGLLDSLSTS